MQNTHPEAASSMFTYDAMMYLDLSCEYLIEVHLHINSTGCSCW